MLFWIGELLESYYGPFRLLSSRVVLASLGTGIAALLAWYWLPRLRKYLPLDRGRDYAVAREASLGKPTGAGLIFIPLYLFTCLLVVPWSSVHLEVWGCVFLAMLFGFLDDNSRRPWGEYRKALMDLTIAFLTALAICQLQEMEVWLPIISPVRVPPVVYLPMATALLWVSINTTNCTDGVDGLSGSLLILAFLYLGSILYLVVGHKTVASYLLVPHYFHGADWGIMAFILLGILAGYLWFNANPSSVLMGDAGSRPLGLLLGIFVLESGNPFLILVVAGVVLVNGGTGLVKVALLRFFKVGIFSKVRFPLHDHCRKNLGWSNAQVLVRFVILQALVTPILIILLLKVR
ncbi:MAG: phospho-N-acetylmuramoyl-pentapeptide-transferase [Planctomycetota bacterium]